jgi:X-Pro dipeptidyl-peptidase (S15 family)
MTAGVSGATAGIGAAGMAPPTAGTAGMATAGAGGVSGAGTGGAPPTSSRPLGSSLKLPTMMEKKAVAPFFNVWRPTDLTKVEGKLPIFVWNNGACSRNDGVFKALFEKWASGGWFVLSLTSGGGSSSTTIADQKALIDWVVAEAGMASSPYKDKLDLDKIAAGGNSCGGITSLGLAAMDPRVKSIFVLSGSSGFGGADMMVTNAIKVPVAYVVGGTEDIARANAESDYAAFAAGIPSMVVNRSSGDHLEISNDAMVMVDAADISINWLDLTIFGLQGGLDALKQPTVCTGCAAGLWKLTSKNLETLVK